MEFSNPEKEEEAKVNTLVKSMDTWFVECLARKGFGGGENV